MGNVTNKRPTEYDCSDVPQAVYHTVKILDQDLQALKRIRAYFGENDKTQLEHLAYDVLNRIIKNE